MMHLLLGTRVGAVCHHGYLITNQPKRHLGLAVTLLVAQADIDHVYCHLLSDSEIVMLEELAPQPGNLTLWQTHDDRLMRRLEGKDAE